MKVWELLHRLTVDCIDPTAEVEVNAFSDYRDYVMTDMTITEVTAKGGKVIIDAEAKPKDEDE